ncbi:hypothetical protein GCM10028861_02040 [Flavobacterium koreense]
MILGFVSYGQILPNGINNDLSPNGVMDNVFDHYGNKYKLSDIKIEPVKYAKITNAMLGTSTTPLHCGYFDLYLEDGCGLNTTDTDYINRRNVITRVFTDLSNFINSPLTTSGKKVNIWVRNMANITGVPSNAVGLASSFYCVPYNTTAGFGGIVDNEIWKTIHIGDDSYKNVVSPLAIDPSNTNATTTGTFYHGMVAFRFDGTVNWNTSLTATTISNTDLYSVALHEITHAIGFTSLIESNGASRLGTGFNYYTRYDLKLKNSTNTNTLISNTGACSPMYNYTFNSSTLTSTTCSNAIKYIGATTVATYTPSVFATGSSLSHFNSSCTSGNFVMNSSIGAGIMRRFYTIQEKNALVEMGYTVNSSFGTSTTFNGSATYTTPLTGIPVAGLNDGINANGTYKYIGNGSSDIIINSATDANLKILANDPNATGFECLQDVFDTTAVINTIAGTTTFRSAVTGLHLLRYVPLNVNGLKGNITYIYVYVNDISNCATPSVCNLVINGDFETHTALSNSLGTIETACGWSNANANYNNGADYFNVDNPSILGHIPCNFVGYETDNISSNKGYVGMTVQYSPWTSLTNSEVIKTRLSTPLLPNTNYQLSFDVSLAEGLNDSTIKFQALLSPTFQTFPGYGVIPIDNQNMFKEYSIFSTKTEGWQKILLNFTTSAGLENTLYLGALSNIQYQPNIQSPLNIHNCNYTIQSNPNNYIRQYYYIDNVSLIPLNGGTFTLPTTICRNQPVPDLRSYLSGLPTTGVFSGTGVSLFPSGAYNFNTTVAPLGVNTITYKYTNSSGCLVTIYCNTNVVQTPAIPVITGNSFSCTTAGNSNSYSIPALTTGQTVTWTITSGAGTITNGTTATPTITWTTLPAKLKVTITNAGTCSSTSTISVGVLQAYITGTSTACTSQTANATKTYSTTLASNQTAFWQIMSGSGTFMSGTTSASATPIIKWTSLPATLKLTITQAGGCSVTRTLIITSLCTASCACLDDLTSSYYTNISDTGGTAIGVEQSTMSDFCDGFVIFNFDFGDGTTSGPTGNYVDHCYPTKTTYNVVCTATMTNGCSRTISFPVLADPCVIPPWTPPTVSSKQSENLLNNNSTNYQIEINPNPTNDLLNIRINNYVGKVNIQVIDINGRIVTEYKNEDFNTEKSLNLNTLQSGMYILKVNGDNVNFTQKIIKN